MISPLGFVSAAGSIGASVILVRPRRSIGPLVAQVTIEEVHDDELEITEHPVEQGAAIADHAYKRPARLRIRCAWSNSPSVAGLGAGIVAGFQGTIDGVQSLVTGNSAASVRDVYAKLLKLQSDRIPFDVFTGKRVYSSMLVKALSITTDKESENTLSVTATFQQVIIVQTQTISVGAPSANQASPSDTQAQANAGSRSLLPSSTFNAEGGGIGFTPQPTVY